VAERHVVPAKEKGESELFQIQFYSVKTLLDPFKLTFALMMFAFRTTGYTATFMIQFFCFSVRGNRDGIIEAFGWYGRSVTDAAAKILE
jgi:hypothetical protein